MGAHVQTPFVHWSAAYLRPQQPLQMTGGVPGHEDEDPEDPEDHDEDPEVDGDEDSEEVDDEEAGSVVKAAPQPTTKAPTERAETIQDFMCMPFPISEQHAGRPARIERHTPKRAQQEGLCCPATREA
jgi:hypothetical protein